MGSSASADHRTDYLAAHRRHWRDAELLIDHERLENADQLYGFSAECGLKAVMLALGMELDDAGGPAERRHRVHVQKLWPEFQVFAAGRDEREYADRLVDAPFEDWSHHHRYFSDGHVEPDALDRHRAGAETVLRLVDVAEQEGSVGDSSPVAEVERSE